MNRSIITIAALFFALIITSVALAANYASTRVYFNIPETTTFTIAMPSTYGSPVTISGASEAAATGTDWVSFNFTTTPESWRQPYRLGDPANTQNGAAAPIMLIDNTGNVNVTMSIRSNETAPMIGTTAGFNISANATGDSASCYSTVAATPVNITASYQNLVTGFNWSGTCRINLTLYGFASASATGGQTTTNLLINATKS